MPFASLDNRQIAVLAWIAVALVAMAAHPRFRPALGSIVRAFAEPQVLVTTAALAAWTAVLVALPAVAGAHEVDPWTEAAVWFVGVGFVLLLNSGKAFREEGWFRERAGKALRATALVEFFLNLAVFSLPVEVALVPVFVLLGAMSAVTSTDKKMAPAKGCVDSILGVAFLALALYVLLRLATDWDSFATPGTIEKLVLPAWLTLGALPFIYVLAMSSAYSRAFRFVRLASDERAVPLHAKLALVLEFGLWRGRDLDRFRLYEGRELAGAQSLTEGRAVVRRFRSELDAERRAAAEHSERLERFAGVDGVDDAGRRLDQREFEETRQALQWLATCQMGWHRNDDRYRSDLLDVVAPFRGLPPEHGIQLIVDAGGQQWWAWRRTVTGWCFAIGAAEPPPDQWLYDGADPPRGPPGVDPAWGERFGLDAPNW
jgi:hypothetical protein